MKTILQIGMVLLISTGMLHAQMLKEHGDAPEGALAYPDNGIIGQFPSCKTVLPNGFIEHNNFGAWFGPGFDFEPDGNAGNCPVFTPNLYNMDECINDGDAGLMICGAFTITGMPGTETYSPCLQGNTASLGSTCMPSIWGQNIDLFVHNTMPNGTTGYINILIDWNRDGQWGGNVMCTQGQVQLIVPEHSLINFPVPGGYVGLLSNLLPPNTHILCGNIPGYVWARFSITEIPVFMPWNGTGSFEDGETEDYLLHVGTAQPVQIDWGDAPDPAYPTLQASNGAQHQIVPGILLGNMIDAEPDGQASSLANGDDNLATDDEDGVTIKWGLLTGSPGNVEILASVAGFLDAWCDFNADGDWADAGEQIFVSVPLVAGANRLSFSIPLLSSQTDTYFRYRFSQTGGLSYSGPASNGEVEDYFEVIGSNSQYKWKQDPDNTLPGLHCHDKVINQAYQQIYFADDWQCNGGQVTEIIWYGAYENPGSGIEKFNIRVYANNSQTCLPLPNPPPPPDSFFDVFVSLSALNETPTGVLNSDGQMIYSYSYTLPVPFPQIAGNRYWLALSSISNDTLNTAIWKWQEASRSHIQTLCPAANMTVINNLPTLWNPTNLANGTHPEMAFQIMNIPAVPVLPTDFIIQAGTWIEAEPWHNWIGGEITDTLSFRLFAHDSLHRIQMVQFFYSSDSINWTLLGTDTSGQEAPSTAGAYDSITPGNGWAVHYPVALLSSVYVLPTPLHLKTEIILNNGETLIYIKPETVSFDPSPPSSFTTNISEWYSTYKDSLEVSVIPGLANAQSWYYVIDKKDLHFNKGIPDAGQQNPLFPNGGANYCAPTSTAACFKYFEGKGDNTICGGLSTNGLILELGKVCKTDPLKGTEFKDWVPGIRKWLEEHGDNYTVRTVEFWKKDANGADIYTFNFYRWLFMRNELEHRQDVLVDMAWFTTPYNWNGAHAVTFNSVWNDPVNGKFRVDFMDPWTKKQEFGWLDPNTGDITGYANSTGYSNLNAKITNLIIICPKEQSVVPLSGGTPVSGYSPPSKKIRILLPGPNFLRVYCQDQDGFQFRKDIVFEWLQADFGDAPDSYQTLLASDGPRHLLDTVTFMGDTIDYDNDGIPTANADGDDLLNIDDEDGVVFASAIYRNDTTSITVTASVQGAFLQAWIDFNQSGTFESPAEQILTDAIVVAGQNTYSIPVPAGATTGNTYARFRLSTQAGVPAFGPAPDGEVEDYRITILEEEFDMGDAPDPDYPTTLANNGARHNLNPALYLGNLIDTEINGQANSTATGDDIGGFDDEDGINFLIPPSVGNPCVIEVIATTVYQNPMYLNAWMDYNGDGDWADQGEQIFTDILINGGSQNLSILVPESAMPGITYCRFRLSSQTGLSFTGFAPDGETEDYQVTIISSPPYAALIGTAFYMNSLQSPMSETDIILQQGLINLDTITTGNDGSFLFQVSTNNSYQLSGRSEKPWGGGNSTDALLILKHFVHMITLTGLYAEAGDVDNSGGINSLDALLTARRFIGSITSFAAGDWVFENPTISVPIPGTYTQNVGALCTGDVNGSFTPAAKEAVSVEIVPDQLITASHEMMLAIRCESALTMGAVSLVLGLPDGITITDIRIPDHANHGTLLFHQTGNEVRISWFDTKAREASNGEILFTLYAKTDKKSEGQIVTLGGSLISDADGRNYEYVRLLGPMITQEKQTDVFMSVNIPNPFKGTTEIWYSIPESGTVDLLVYNAMGAVVRKLVNSKQQQAGLHHILFDCQGCSPGLYYYKLNVKTSDSVLQKQQNMILLKQ